MGKVYKGPYWNGSPEHDQHLYERIVAKAERMYYSKPEFKAQISKDDFLGEAMLLFQTRKVHASYAPEKGDFWRFFGVSLRNTVIDKLASTYGHLKGSRVRDTDSDAAKVSKFAGSEMAIQRLDDENLHERVDGLSDGGNSSPEAMLGLDDYEELIWDIGPTLASVWFGDVNHPHQMMHPQNKTPLLKRKERMAIIEDEADRVLAAVAEDLLDQEISQDIHDGLVREIVETFSKWRGHRGEYKKKEKKIEEEEPS